MPIAALALRHSRGRKFYHKMAVYGGSHTKLHVFKSTVYTTSNVYSARLPPPDGMTSHKANTHKQQPWSVTWSTYQRAGPSGHARLLQFFWNPLAGIASMKVSQPYAKCLLETLFHTATGFLSQYESTSFITAPIVTSFKHQNYSA